MLEPVIIEGWCVGKTYRGGKGKLRMSDVIVPLMVDGDARDRARCYIILYYTTGGYV